MYETEYRTHELIGPNGHTGTTETVYVSTVIFSNDEGQNGEVLKIKMIKTRTKCSTE